SRSRGTGGVGLGLTIARQAILREMGTIRLLNRPGAGLRAEVTIPLRNEARTASDTEPSTFSLKPASRSPSV
ncbi:ATP-binding protein, partial [Leclercia adecarboxylata]|uniref:ATP-binding protein n=1 Tax=Leclercia adecarboxylata TaxID=83655 RepID=UPI0036F1FE46